MSEKLKDITILFISRFDDIAFEEMNYMLTHLFKQLFLANDICDGIDILQKSLIDMILIDIDVYKRCGISIIKELKSSTTIIPIVVLTAYSDDDYLKELNNLKVTYVSKPFIRSEFIKKVLEASENL